MLESFPSGLKESATMKDTLFHVRAFDNLYGGVIAESFFVERFGDVARARFMKRHGERVKDCTVFTGKLYAEMVVKLGPLGLLEL